MVSALIGSAALAASAHASLNVSYQFNGNGNWSLDAVGSNSTPVGDLSAVVPTGSTVVKAFLYSTNVSGVNTVPTVNFDGTLLSGVTWTSLGTNAQGLTAFRADVTSQVSAKIGSGSASEFTFSILSENVNNSIDGEALAIVYSNPTEQKRTIAFLDGNSNSAGDSTAINLSTPLTSSQLADSNFEALMSLGIGYSYQSGSNQYSIVNVNGSRLTSSAGGEDDGISANGGLITIGGIGDSITNPAAPFALGGSNPRQDDELYSLKPYLSSGMTSIAIQTQNPSGDDNIFFAGFNITADAGVNQPPPPPPSGVPDAGSTVALMGMSLAGLLALRRRLH